MPLEPYVYIIFTACVHISLNHMSRLSFLMCKFVENTFFGELQ